MVRLGRKYFLAAFLAGFALFAIPVVALAVSFGINIVGPGLLYGGAGITVLDNGAGDLDPVVNQIAVSAGGSLATPPIPGFVVSFDFALGNSPGGPPLSLLSLSWTLLSSTGGAIQVTASSTDFAFPLTGTPSILESTILGGTGGSVTGQQWANLNNTFFEGGPVSGITPGLHGPFGPGAFTETLLTDFISSTPYSITERVNLILGAGSSTSGSLNSVAAIGEPPTLILLGAALVGFAGYGRRQLNRRKRK